jgi:2-dehydropantoate 2-reductase
MTDRLLIFGSGAMACWLGAVLTRAGTEVALYTHWKESQENIRSQGIQVTEANGATWQVSVQVIDTFENQVPFFAAIVLEKSWQTGRVASLVPQLMDRNAPILTLQNGWGNREILQNGSVEHLIMAGSCTYGATLIAPGQVKATAGGTISLPALDAALPIQKILTNSRLDVSPSAETETILWRKLILNSAINPITALLQMENGEMILSSSAMALAARLIEEGCITANSYGIHLIFSDLLSFLREVLQKTANNHSSMRQDWDRRRPTEIEAINGAIVSMAYHQHIPVPTQQTLLELIRTGAEKYLDPNSSEMQEYLHDRSIRKELQP